MSLRTIIIRYFGTTGSESVQKEWTEYQVGSWISSGLDDTEFSVLDDAKGYLFVCTSQHIVK